MYVQMKKMLMTENKGKKTTNKLLCWMKENKGKDALHKHATCLAVLSNEALTCYSTSYPYPYPFL